MLIGIYCNCDEYVYIKGDTFRSVSEINIDSVKAWYMIVEYTFEQMSNTCSVLRLETRVSD